MGSNTILLPPLFHNDDSGTDGQIAAEELLDSLLPGQTGHGLHVGAQGVVHPAHIVRGDPGKHAQIVNVLIGGS